MKKLIVLCFFIPVMMYPQGFVIKGYYTTTLTGFENHQGHSTLLYRLFYDYYMPANSGGNWNHNLYAFDVGSGVDTTVAGEGGQPYGGTGYYDYGFWAQTLKKYLIGINIHTREFGDEFYLKSHNRPLWKTKSPFYSIETSETNDSLAFIGLGSALLRTTNMGMSWDTIKWGVALESLHPGNDSILFARSTSGGGTYSKSTDGGLSFYAVDSRVYQANQYLKNFYDADNTHIYRVAVTSDDKYHLLISDNNGEAGSWVLKYVSSKGIPLTCDRAVPGKVLYATGDSILFSTDGGLSFQLWFRASHPVVGLYQKPGGPLYYATREIIYEKTDTSQRILRYIAPRYALIMYPLHNGDKWIYTSQIIMPGGAISKAIVSRTVTGEQLCPNGKRYFIIREQGYGHSIFGPEISLERVDTMEAKVYQYVAGHAPNDEVLLDELTFEKGESFHSFRFGETVRERLTTVVYYDYFSWIGGGDYRYKKVFNFQGDTIYTAYSVADNVGLFTANKYLPNGGVQALALKGCVINGKKTGDTTTSEVNSEFLMEEDFRLAQNYPNPFNPKTVISYSLPERSHISLKVYTMLGQTLDVLFAGEKDKGDYQIEFDGGSLPSGMYFYSLETGARRITKKMTLIR